MIDAVSSGGYSIHPSHIHGTILMETGAAPSVSKTGAPIGEGALGARLCIKGLEDPKFFVPIMIIGEGDLARPDHIENIRAIEGRDYFRVELDDGREAWVEIAEFAHRLHFSERKVRTCANEGKIGTLLARRQHFDAVIRHYLTLVQRYEESAAEGSPNRETLKPYYADPDQHLSPKTLMKMIRVAIRDLAVHNDENQSPQAQHRTVHGHHIVAIKDPSGDVTLGLTQAPVVTKKSVAKEIRGFIGSGGYSIVYRIFNLSFGQEQALKVGRTDIHTPEGAQRDLENEQRILRIIYQSMPPGTIKGIVDEPHVVAPIVPAGSTAMLLPLYHAGSFDKTGRMMITLDHGGIDDRPRREVLEAICELLQGLATIQAAGVRHGDMKPDNILAKEDQDGKLHLLISDFGGAETYEELWQELLDCEGDETKILDLSGTRTHRYVDRRYPAALIDAGKRAHALKLAGDTEKLEEFKQSCIQYEKGLDTLALGVAIFEMLTGSAPFHRIDGYLDVESGVNASGGGKIVDNLGRWYGDSVAFFLTSMLSKDLQYRRSPEWVTEKLVGRLNDSSSSNVEYLSRSVADDAYSGSDTDSASSYGTSSNRSSDSMTGYDTSSWSDTDSGYDTSS